MRRKSIVSRAWRSTKRLGRSSRRRRAASVACVVAGLSAIVVPIRSQGAVHDDGPAGPVCPRDDSQRDVAVRAQMFAWCFAEHCVRCRDRCGFIGRHAFAAFGHVPPTVAIAVTAEATGLRVAFRQNVQTPATHEFDAAQRDIFRLVTAAVSLAGASRESDDPIFVTDESPIRNWSACHVAGQIFDDMLR